VLARNKVGVPGVMMLGDAIKSGAALQSLDLHGNELPPQAAGPLAEALRRGAVLRELLLQDNALGVVGAALLADGLKQNEGLTSLDVQRNDIGEGATLLDDASRDVSDLIVWK